MIVVTEGKKELRTWVSVAIAIVTFLVTYALVFIPINTYFYDYRFVIPIALLIVLIPTFSIFLLLESRRNNQTNLPDKKELRILVRIALVMLTFYATYIGIRILAAAFVPEYPFSFFFEVEFIGLVLSTFSMILMLNKVKPSDNETTESEASEDDEESSVN